MTAAWVAVLVVGAGSYLLRLLPLVLTGRFAVPDRAAQLLQDAGLAAMATLLMTSATAVVREQDGFGLAVLAGCLLVGGGLAYAGRSVVVVVGGGAAAYAVGALLLAAPGAL
jgi:branched-subunit amino acid transport protein